MDLEEFERREGERLRKRDGYQPLADTTDTYKPIHTPTSWPLTNEEALEWWEEYYGMSQWPKDYYGF